MSDVLFQPLGDPSAGGDNLEHVADIDPRMTRTHYFDGRLLTAEDLERDQIYLDQRLREVGKVLGTGIISGLELSFDPFSARLALTSGQAVTPAGRVLHLGRQLIVNLANRALISQLNGGRYRRFNRALYAVVLRYADVATDIAEVFPTDLGDRRGADYALITESVQMGLVPLPIPLPQQDKLFVRAGLIRELLGNGPAEGVIPEDAVALGVLAIQDDIPRWLDTELLRHPLRRDSEPARLQADLARQYQALLQDVLEARLSSGLTQGFAAKDYFSLLPPVGRIPKNTLNPVEGFQGYFPPSFQVSVAPVRRSDMELIKRESLGLPNIDLTTDSDVSLVVLAPLADNDYGHYARQLLGTTGSDQGFRSPDLLRLHLYPSAPVHALDTDASVWEAIWNRASEEELFYVRRPLRAAETAVSGIVLANGTHVPEPAEPPPENNEGGPLIEDEDTVFLRRVNVRQLSEWRPPGSEEGEAAVARLEENSGQDARSVQRVMVILLRVERHYDAVIWQTLADLQERDVLERLLELVTDTEPGPRATGLGILENSGNLGLSDGLRERWQELVEALPS